MDSIVKSQLGSPNLPPSTIVVHAWDAHPSQSLNLYKNFHIIVTENMIMINIKVIDTLLDYNLLLGHIYTYEISIVTSSMFFKMCFPIT